MKGSWVGRASQSGSLPVASGKPPPVPLRRSVGPSRKTTQSSTARRPYRSLSTRNAQPKKGSLLSRQATALYEPSVPLSVKCFIEQQQHYLHQCVEVDKTLANIKVVVTDPKVAVEQRHAFAVWLSKKSDKRLQQLSFEGYRCIIKDTKLSSDERLKFFNEAVRHWPREKAVEGLRDDLYFDAFVDDKVEIYTRIGLAKVIMCEGSPEIKKKITDLYLDLLQQEGLYPGTYLYMAAFALSNLGGSPRIKDVWTRCYNLTKDLKVHIYYRLQAIKLLLKEDTLEQATRTDTIKLCLAIVLGEEQCPEHRIYGANIILEYVPENKNARAQALALCSRCMEATQIEEYWRGRAAVYWKEHAAQKHKLSYEVAKVTQEYMSRSSGHGSALSVSKGSLVLGDSVRSLQSKEGL